MKRNVWQKSALWKSVILAVIALIVNLPVVSALQLSNIRAEDITATSAVVRWETDEAADSFVFYREDEATDFNSRGDAALVEQHSISLSSLQPETSYSYKVRSAGVESMGSGNLYTFTTPVPDTGAPLIEIELPAYVQGARLDILQGNTEAAAQVKITINGEVKGSTFADAEGEFTFSNVELAAGQSNELLIEATDTTGNSASVSGTVISDTQRPEIMVQNITGAAEGLVQVRTITLRAGFSEMVSYELFLNNRSVASGEGASAEKQLALEEGTNSIRIVVSDAAGWQREQELTIQSDTQPPQIRAEIERGTEYYEGRAESTIHGETEPGAIVFLYVYRPLLQEFKPDFQRARASAAADEAGQFIFRDVDFAATIRDIGLEELAPREVPSGLLNYIIQPSQAAQQERFSYYVFLIAEDATGKTGFWQQAVNVNTCFSPNLDFSAVSNNRFQFPLRLVPQLMDEGRQEVQAVFELDYLGDAIPKLVGDAVVEQAAMIDRVDFEPACTRAMAEDEKFGVGCKILPARTKALHISPEHTAVYVSWQLHPTEDMSSREEDFWNDFKDRQVMFPLKMRISYRERQGEAQYGPAKQQTVCTDLGYFVDIPVEAREMLPDFLTDEGVSSLEWTLEQIRTVRPILEKVYIITGIVAISSFLLLQVARWSRLVTSRLEAYFDFVKPKRLANAAGENFDETGKCKLNQNELYLQSTLDNWKELYEKGEGGNLPEDVVKAFKAEIPIEQITLDKVCPKTAAAWKLEESVEKIFRLSADRAFCRAVPARWTEDKSTDEIGSVILKQQQCAVTGRGVPLVKRENCQEIVKALPTAQVYRTPEETGGVCWQSPEALYYVNQDKQTRELTQKGIWVLSPVADILGDLRIPDVDLIVFRPEGSEEFFIARDETCEQVCSNPRKPGYGADKGVQVRTSSPFARQGGEIVQVAVHEPVPQGRGDVNGCYVENLDDFGQITLFDREKQKLGEQDKRIGLIGNRYPAGYTKDCFIDGWNTGQVKLEDGKPVLKQCVCVGAKEDRGEHQTTDNSLRTALPRKETGSGEGLQAVEEKYSYREDRVFKESRRSKGTYYPKERYYAGRDFTGAFGQSHLLDVVTGTEEIHEINPHSQFIGMFQSVCLSGMLKNLRMLENILTGLRNCLVEAKTTGVFDAGMCKAWFTQHVCGLVYKGIAYLANQCNPLTFDDVGKEGIFGDVGAIVSTGFDALPEAIDSSIKDLREDYGNAALNEYFKGGAQGYAQSICMGAFGFGWPMFSDEFLLEAAYATPMKTSVLVTPAHRELSTYNPATQRAVHNYEIGAGVLAGCRIRNYKVSLKCIGPEDLGYPNVDTSCDGQGCDCLNVQNVGALEGERTKLLQSGTSIASGDWFSVPLESPLPIESNFRYDHVLVELVLDPSERGNEDKCFDEGYGEGNKGIFYAPIKDISPRVELGCRADALTGRYICPELAGYFGFGGAALESPFVSCWNKALSQWVDCDSPNLFIMGDEIRLRAHINLNEEGKCLKRTVQPAFPGVQYETIRSLPAHLPGPQTLEDSLGIVRPEMFGGAQAETVTMTANSNPSCGLGLQKTATAITGRGPFKFTYIPQADGKVQVRIEGNAFPVSSGYSAPASLLTRGSDTSFTVNEVNGVRFNLGGFEVSNIIGNARVTDANKLCEYEIKSTGGRSAAANTREIQVTYEMLERDEGGTCSFARIPVKTTIGSARHTARIRVQQEQTAFAARGGFHDSFMSGNYDNVNLLALNELQKKQGDLNNAIALYYATAALIMKGGGVQTYRTEIHNTLRVFFDRTWTQGDPLLPEYDASVMALVDYEKILKYLCVVADQAGYSSDAQKKKCV